MALAGSPPLYIDRKCRDPCQEASRADAKQPGRKIHKDGGRSFCNAAPTLPLTYCRNKQMKRYYGIRGPADLSHKSDTSHYLSKLRRDSVGAESIGPHYPSKRLSRQLRQ